MNIIEILLSVICMSILIGFLIVAAVLGTRSKMKYASQIREVQARGAFADMNTPEIKSRYRRFAILSLFGSFGMIFSIVIFFIQRANGNILPGITIIAAIVFGIIATIGGYLMKREVDRRL